jgi:hypothetical protein
MRRETVKMPWTPEDLALLEQTYISGGGLSAACAALPHRSRDSVRGKVEYLRLRIPGRESYRRQVSTEWIDAQIKRAYRNVEPRLKELSRVTDRTIGWLKYRAGVLGLRRVNDARYNAPWEAEEQAILQDAVAAGRTVGAIHKRLRNAGFNRSLTAIQARISTLKLRTCRNGMTANEVAQLMGVDDHVVLRWLTQNKLRGERSVGTSIAAYIDEIQHPMWQISYSALRDFMLDWPGDWDHRKVGKVALLDILCGGKKGLRFQEAR